MQLSWQRAHLGYTKPWVPPQYCISLSIMVKPVVPALRRPRQWKVEGTESEAEGWVDRISQWVKVLTYYESLGP